VKTGIPARPKVGIIPVFADHQRRGAHHRGVLQPQIGPLIAALLPEGVDIDIVNDTWEDPDWRRHYDLLFISCLHSDFDRARQIAHYWRRRGAKTVLGGNLASTFPQLVTPYFDAVVIGDPETTVPRIWQDFTRGALQPLYVAGPYDPAQTPTPRYDLVLGKQPMPIGVETSRGCPFSCEFCALTALGTRYQVRPPASVIRDIEAARACQHRFAFWPRRNIAGFYDNNIGGGKRELRALCDALASVHLYWGVCIGFNMLRDEDMLARLARAGCRCLFVGFESFNSATLDDLGKRQNSITEVRAAIERCRRQGILVMAGLMLSPSTDDIAYIDSIPERLRDCGLHVPTYVAFETPFPGTPHFARLAAEAEPAFLPNALLRDFNGYTLVMRPRHATTEEFIAAYKRVVGRVFAPSARLRKLALDAAGFLRRGHLIPLVYDAVELATERPDLPPARNYLAGLDIAPPEYDGRVPLAAVDFDSSAHRHAVLEPTKVTDADGRVLPIWLDARTAYPCRRSTTLTQVPSRPSSMAYPSGWTAAVTG
jgi:Radical SAM superfamily